MNRSKFVQDELQLKAIAIALAYDDDFFVHDGNAWLGSWDDYVDDYERWLDHVAQNDTPDTRDEWIKSECIPLSCEYDENQYLVLSDHEAFDYCEKEIRKKLWAFNPAFLADKTGIDQIVYECLENNRQKERNNEAIFRLIGLDNWVDFVQACIDADGAGHFLSSYDGEEKEVNLFEYTGFNKYVYVYRKY